MFIVYLTFFLYASYKIFYSIYNIFSSDDNFIKYNNIYFYKKNYLKYKNNYEIINLIEKKNYDSEYKLIKVLRNNNRSSVKLYQNDNHKIVIKNYKTILGNKYYLFREFQNMCNFNDKFATEPILFYSQSNLCKNDNYLVYTYIDNQHCSNRYYNIAKIIKDIHLLGYTYSDVKEPHFIWNKNKMYLIDIDHHLAKNKGIFSELFRKINIEHSVNRIPKIKKYFKTGSCIFQAISLLKRKLEKLIRIIKNLIR